MGQHWRKYISGFNSKHIQLQQILQTIGAAASALGDVTENVDDCREDVAIAVGQQCRGLDVIHLGDLVVQLDKAGGGLSAGDGDEAFLDDGAVVGLNRVRFMGH